MTDGGAVCPAVFRCLRGVGNMAKKMNPVAEGFYALGKDITDIGVTFADGDWKTRVSYLIFGFGPLMRGQIVKGLGFLLCEAAFIAYLLFFGGNYLSKFNTLGTVETAKKGRVTVYGDNSFLILLYSLLTVVMIAALIFLWRVNVRSNRRAQLTLEAGKHLPSNRKDLQSLLDEHFDKTLLALPVLGIFAAMLAGACSGFVTAFLQTVLGVPSILAGIIVNTGLYTINLMVMGFSSNLSIFGTDTVFSLMGSLFSSPFWITWNRLLLLLLIVAVICVLLHLFLRTRLGLSIRATGDSLPMVRASSINPAFTITVGLCVSNSLTGLAGSLIAQYNKMSDINLGTGMVTIALASLIIGETLFGRGKMFVRIIGVVAGAVLYRFIMAVALRLNVPSEAFKLVSAVIVAAAIAAPAAKNMIRFRMKVSAARKRRRAEEKGGSGSC